MHELKSKRLHLRKLNAEDASERYASWLNDPVVNRFLEVRHVQHSILTCQSFIATTNADESSHLLGIFTNEGSKHIGNIKLGPIDARYSSGQVSLFIGEKEFWGAGYATEALHRIAQFAFDDLKLFRLEAGCYEDNLGSLRVFLKSGFTVEGFFRKKFTIDGKRTGCFWLGALRDEWKDNRI
ncbi:MAG: GNAT family N-acetyltransferase [Gammaproteobacteria bacterium]|nr:GNAT family N-acetyltransferase [Gammaproteobacteria bacterium]